MNHFYLGNKQQMQNLVIKYEAMSQKGKVSSLEVTAFLSLIDFYRQEGSISKALEVTDRAILQHKFSSELHTCKAKLLIAAQKGSEALESLERAEVFGQSFVVIDLLRTKVFCLQKNYSQALSLLLDLRLNYFITNEEYSDVLVQEASIYQSQEEYTQMFEALQIALTKNYQNASALKDMWLATELSKMYPESIAFHHQLLEIDAYSYRAWYNLGNAYFKTADYENALISFEYAILTNERFQPAYLDYVEVCMQLRKYHQALDCLEDARIHFDYDDELLQKVGECYENMGHIDEAKMHFFKGLALNDKNDEIYFHIGECYAKEEQWSSALYFYKQAIKIHDGYEEYFFGLANALFQLGYIQKAEPMYLRATMIAPELSIYWAQYAAFLFKQSRFEAALQVIEDSAATTYGADIFYCKAACLFRKNQRKEALNSLGEALSANFEQQTLFFALVPELEFDEDIKAIIKYYEGEC